MNRAAIWEALAELWLDTELQPCQHAHIARILHDSGLSRAEIEAILLYEVAPAVWSNLWSVAGQWSGFDAQWLADVCERNLRQRSQRWHRLRCRLLKRLMLGPIREDWAKVIGQLEGR